MTKEEAIQIIDSLDPAVMIKTTASNKQIREAIDMAVKALSKPSFPSNLDEAAELEPAIDEYLRVVKETSLRQIARYFAQWGAKWVAGQFQKIEGEPVDWYSASDGKDYCYGVKTQDAFEVPEGFYIKNK